MLTFLFSDLSHDAQKRAIQKYGEDQIICELVDDYLLHLGKDLEPEDNEDAERIIFNQLDWRFTEHGERIA